MTRASPRQSKFIGSRALHPIFHVSMNEKKINSVCSLLQSETVKSVWVDLVNTESEWYSSPSVKYRELELDPELLLRSQVFVKVLDF